MNAVRGGIGLASVAGSEAHRIQAGMPRGRQLLEGIAALEIAGNLLLEALMQTLAETYR
jgi:hypothetical protein